MKITSTNKVFRNFFKFSMSNLHGAHREDFKEPPKPKKIPEYFQPRAKPLTGEELESAIKGQIAYPKVLRKQNDPPLAGQTFSNISFMMFSEPKKMTNGKMAYGFFKQRGSFASEEDSTVNAEDLIRDVDSKFKIRITRTGCWYPLLEESAMDDITTDKLDVKMNKDDESEVHLRDRAAKEKLAKERRIQREIREKEDELRNGGDIYDDQKSLEFYTMKRVTEMRLIEAREHKTKLLEDIHKNIVDTRKILADLEFHNPEYNEEWINRYNEERAKTGIPAFKPGEDQFEEYEKYRKNYVPEKTGDGEMEEKGTEGKGKEEETEEKRAAEFVRKNWDKR